MKNEEMIKIPEKRREKVGEDLRRGSEKRKKS